MTKSTAKPKRNPTFTLGELKAIRRSIVASNVNFLISGDDATALEKVTNSIVYREDNLPIHKGDDA